jgi:hypothetical protein
MSRDSRYGYASLWLTVPIAMLLAMAAGAGIFVSGLYRDPPGLAAQAIGQDAISLFVALPALLISAFMAGRGHQRARLIWLGVLVYVAYTYASYSFGIRFNPLFLIYVALLGCSTYALMGGLAATDWTAVKAGFSKNAPVRAIGIYLGVIGALFYLIWMSEALPASLAGVAPESVVEDGTPTNAIHVLDMGLLLPALLIAAVSLWRRRPLGFGLAAALLANLVLLGLAILSMTVFQGQAGEAVPLSGVAIFATLFAVSLAFLVVHLRHLSPVPMVAST